MKQFDIARRFYEEQRRCAAILDKQGETDRADAVRSSWLKFNGRLKRVLGRANVNRIAPTFGRIEIGATHQRSDARVRDVVDTIRHELAHVAAWEDKSHGYQWQRMAVLFGAKPSPKARGIKYTRNKRTDHEARCPDCNKTLLLSARRAGRLRRGTHYVRHRGCGSDLVLTGKTRRIR